nr:hypothetical protein Iba_chr14eCG10660 [Ipomoea batatas]
MCICFYTPPEQIVIGFLSSRSFRLSGKPKRCRTHTFSSTSSSGTLELENHVFFCNLLTSGFNLYMI